MNNISTDGVPVKLLREPLYDTYSQAAAAAPAALPKKIQFFVKGKSSDKGIHLTNLNDDGKLPPPERMSVYRAPRFVFTGMIEGDIVAMVKAYVCKVIVAGSDQFTGPLEYCAGGGGVDTNPNNGTPSVEAVVAFPEDLRIDIEAGQKFEVQLITEGAEITLAKTGDDPAGKGLFVRCMLDGVHQLPQG